MSANVIVAVSEIATFMFSVGISTFIAGVRWGGVQQELRAVESRLTRIEGMFELKLRQDERRNEL